MGGGGTFILPYFTLLDMTCDFVQEDGQEIVDVLSISCNNHVESVIQGLRDLS